MKKSDHIEFLSFSIEKVWYMIFNSLRAGLQCIRTWISA